jgi:hypothetical protein
MPCLLSNATVAHSVDIISFTYDNRFESTARIIDILITENYHLQ